MGLVTELRLSLTVSDFEALRAFYRDGVALEEAASWDQHGHGVVFRAGRATLELLDAEHAAHVDEVETGTQTGTQTGTAIRIALQVPDAETAARRLEQAGAALLGGPTDTPWGDRNARVQPPEGPPLTVFTSPGTQRDAKADLHRYLKNAREAVVWKLEGLSEYDVRRPLVPTGTNLLGLVKHLASVELGYFGDTFARPSGIRLPWFEEGAEANADLWATADESREQILDLYHRAWAHCDATIEALDLESTGQVPWWPEDRREVTLQLVLVHMIAETNRHGGHADIVRELIDGTVGLRADNDNMVPGDEAWWADYRAQVERAARRAGGPSRSSEGGS
jgi:predicted enzyme related to lactoylglutathione lyase/uncharacterized damage-inducible protein DinB